MSIKFTSTSPIYAKSDNRVLGSVAIDVVSNGEATPAEIKSAIADAYLDAQMRAEKQEAPKKASQTPVDALKSLPLDNLLSEFAEQGEKLLGSFAESAKSVLKAALDDLL